MVFKIFKKKIAIELMCNGFNMVFTETNRHKKWLTVFCFEESEKLHQAITLINEREHK